MKFILVLFVLAAISMASPVPQIIKHQEIHTKDGYRVEYHLDDGTIIREYGYKVRGGDDDVYAKLGLYKFTTPEGVTYEVTYTADASGAQPLANVPVAIYDETN